MLLTTVCGAVREYVFARFWGYIAKEISPIINKKLMHRKKTLRDSQNQWFVLWLYSQVLKTSRETGEFQRARQLEPHHRS